MSSFSALSAGRIGQEYSRGPEVGRVARASRARGAEARLASSAARAISTAAVSAATARLPAGRRLTRHTLAPHGAVGARVGREDDALQQAARHALDLGDRGDAVAHLLQAVVAQLAHALARGDGDEVVD